MPIFCYLYSMVNHNENDCLVRLRRIERLNSEDKPFGSWMRVTQERLQKPQLVLAPPDSDRETQRNTSILAQPAMVMDSSLRSAAEGGHAQMATVKDNKGGRADVESVLVHIDKEIPRIPQSQ